jgi:hypothetical protein
LSPISLASTKSFWLENQFGPTVAGSFFFYISPAPAQSPSGPNSLASPPGHAAYTARFTPAHPIFIPYLRSRPTRHRRLRQSPYAAARLFGLPTAPSSPRPLCPRLSTKNRTVAPSSLLPLLPFFLSLSFRETITINARHTPAAIPPPLTPCLTPSSAI